MRRGKITKRQELRSKAGNLFQEAIIARDRYCALCGLRARDGHHIIEKSVSEYLRYDMRNGVGLCGRHHRLVQDENPFAIKALEGKLGEERIAYLDQHKHKLVKCNLEYLEKNIKKLQKEKRKWLSHR